MAPLGIFKRKKEEKEKKKVREKTLLEDLCKGDEELYSALSRALPLNPEIAMRTGELDARVGRAQEYEKSKDSLRARVEYQIAGGLALYEGKTAQVSKLFKKAAEVDPDFAGRSAFDFLANKENAERAVAVAQEYYSLKAKPLK